MWKMWKVKMTAPFFTGRIFFRRSGPGGGGLAGACRRDNSSANISPYRLAVPEKIFALFVRSIFSTATDSPPRFIRHRRRSAPNPAHRDPLGYSGISPIGGASLLQILISTPTRRGLICSRLRRGKPFSYPNLYACRRGVREKDCSHLRWRKSYKGLN